MVEREVDAIIEMDDRNYALSSGKSIADGCGKRCVKTRCCAKRARDCGRLTNDTPLPAGEGIRAMAYAW